MSTHTNENDPAMPFGQISEQTGQPINGWFFAGLTAREHAAIHLRVPMSGNPWLDEMITEARRWDAAQAAMCGIVEAVTHADLHNSAQTPPEDIAAGWTQSYANALIYQMKGDAQ